VQLDRISYEYPDGTTAGYDLHPRLTVIDVHPAHRSALVEHLVQSLWSDAPGVHVEATRRDGTPIVAFRPYGAAARVITIGRSEDLTADYFRNDRVDLLAPTGIDPTRAQRALLVDRADLTQVDPTVEWLSRLAGEDLDELIDAAGAATRAETELEAASRTLQAEPQVAEAVCEAYARRDSTSALETRHNRIRVATLLAGTAGPVAAVLLLGRIGAGAALAIIGASVLVALGCIWFERKLARAVDAEYEALSAAGSRSYEALDRQVGGTALADPDSRIRLIETSERLHEATERWHRLAGSIPAAWVIEHRDRLATLAELRSAHRNVVGSTTPAAASASGLLLAALVERARGATALAGGESLPLFLDDPVAGLPAPDKTAVLDAVSRIAADQQMIICTDDVEVLEWARLESLAERALVIDANPGRHLQPAASPRER